MDSAIYTKLASLTIKTQNKYYAGTGDNIRIKLFSEHNTYVKAIIVLLF